MQYKFRSDKIISIGDTHSTETVKDILNLHIPNGSDCWHCGDIGLGFGNISYAIENALSWLDMFNKKCVLLDINLYLNIGNHDATYPTIWDSKWSNVFMLKTGDTATFPNGKKVLFVGGGLSVDRCNRIEGLDYWKDEITKPLDNVEKCDIVFSHDCPEHFNYPTSSLYKIFQWAIDKDPTLLLDCETQRKTMTKICKDSWANTIIYGHYHNSDRQYIDGVYAKCLDINELWEFDANKEYF